MVRIASRRMIGGGSGVISPSGIVVTTTAAGTSLGGGTVSAGNTSTAANVSITPTPSTPIYNTTGPSIRQLGGGGVASPTGIRTIASVSTGSDGSAGSESASSNTNYKLSIASMLMAMKNQALGSLSLGGSKSGGSVTENISGINLG